MPSLSVKAAAEMLVMPAYSQARILQEQKHPKSGSQVFKVPYYRPAMNGISSYFKSGKSKASLLNAKSKIEGIAQESRRDHNKRVLMLFEESTFLDRDLIIQSSPKVTATIAGVDFRLSPDLRAIENDEQFVFYINCRAQAVDPNIARMTLEAAHWILESNFEKIPLKNIQYLDLVVGELYSFKKRRSTTIKHLEQNAEIIHTLWDSV